MEPAAEARLAVIWIEAEDKADVLDAVRAFDHRLRIDPLDCGESRDGNSRVGFLTPLGLDFEVFPLDRKVIVLAVWRIDHN